jgi:hypothetical protein
MEGMEGMKSINQSTGLIVDSFLFISGEMDGLFLPFLEGINLHAAQACISS